MKLRTERGCSCGKILSEAICHSDDCVLERDDLDPIQAIDLEIAFYERYLHDLKHDRLLLIDEARKIVERETS